MDYKKAFKRIKQLSYPGSLAKDILELYQNILEFQKTSFERVGLDYKNIPVSMATELPLLHALENFVDEEKLFNLTRDFLNFISLFGTEKMKKEAKEAAESPSLSLPYIKKTFVDYVKEGKVEGSILPEFLNLIVLSVAPVIFSPISKELEKQLSEDFNGTSCPFCGYKPVVGYLSKEREGKRILICPVCYGEWPSKRDVCPFCGNEELEEHDFFLFDGEEGLRVDICGKCKHYIKTFDERVFDEKGITCVPLIEEVATPHIDLRMVQEGFEKVSKNIFYF